MANLDLIIFLVNNKVSDLRELEMEQYGTLKISIRVPINAVPQVPTIKLFFWDETKSVQSSQVIKPREITGILNEAIGTTDFTSTIDPIDTESLILDSTLGEIFGLHLTDARYRQLAKKLYIEIQLIASEIRKTWQGSIVVKSGGRRKFILTWA
jgi:hypothetical protein